MKANELMIGDWVDVYCEDRYENGFYKPGQIYGIHDNEVCFGTGLDFPWFPLDEPDTIEPIPLTKEILHKNGFCGEVGLWINVGDERVLEYYDHRLSLYCTEEGNQELLFRCQCFYVHEFQHILKLYGIEKEIVL